MSKVKWVNIALPDAYFKSTRSFVPLDLISCLDQPNRAVRTRMLRGVGGALSDERPYPDGRDSAAPQ